MKPLLNLIVIGCVSCAALVGCNANAPEKPAQGAPAQERPGNQGSDSKNNQGSDNKNNQEQPKADEGAK